VIRYTLSNRQRTALFTRDTAIRIALPVHPIDIDSLDAAGPQQLRRWAAARLDGIRLDEVQSAELVDLYVVRSSGGDGLTGVLGTVADEPPPEDLLSLVVTAVVARLARGSTTRHASDRIQWPGSATSPDRKWPLTKEGGFDGKE